MVTGACLCGAVRFEIEAFVGPFELCHCSRCRKASGSAFVAGIGVRARHFGWISGESLVRFFEAPVRRSSPGYRTAFCIRCGGPAPNLSSVTEKDDWFEIAAGLLDQDVGVVPDRHIFVDYAASWDEIAGSRPQCTEHEVIEMRKTEYEEGRGRWSQS